MLALLENDDQLTARMAFEVDDTLDIRAIIETMRFYYEQHSEVSCILLKVLLLFCYMLCLRDNKHFSPCIFILFF